MHDTLAKLQATERRAWGNFRDTLDKQNKAHSAWVLADKALDAEKRKPCTKT